MSSVSCSSKGAPALLLLLLCGDRALADTVDDELKSLLSVLDEQTQLAAKNRLNKDYVPGLVNVLQGEDLRDRGVRTVWLGLHSSDSDGYPLRSKAAPQRLRIPLAPGMPVTDAG